MVNSPGFYRVVWHPPTGTNCIKVNVDGCSKGNPGPAGCGGVFRVDNGRYIGAFAANLGFKDSVFAELMGIIMAVELAHSRRWRNLWIESDSTMALKLLTTDSLHKVPAELVDRWLKCKSLVQEMDISCSHVYREGNVVADILANMGLCFPLPVWLECPPAPIHRDLVHDSLGLPRYRIIQSH
ncbi:hypothetical protein LWI29_024814 [Acer saccharum]|uniref:RNase H type-1 domain-containing protein n=1 Tax=Acer saccharum TaxID=4024 RepID=A0AA39T9D2_ACESA|nr:hypothetical protein LWI29_024814 [Acer saccharum]